MATSALGTRRDSFPKPIMDAKSLAGLPAPMSPLKKLESLPIADTLASSGELPRRTSLRAKEKEKGAAWRRKPESHKHEDSTGARASVQDYSAALAVLRATCLLK